jgi:hypothetical protein
MRSTPTQITGGDGEAVARRAAKIGNQYERMVRRFRRTQEPRVPELQDHRRRVVPPYVWPALAISVLMTAMGWI